MPDLPGSPVCTCHRTAQHNQGFTLMCKAIPDIPPKPLPGTHAHLGISQPLRSAVDYAAAKLHYTPQQ